MIIKRLCFFLSGEDKPYAGAVRPFLNWAVELSKKGHEVTFLLLNCGSELKGTISKLSNVKPTYVKSIKEIQMYLRVTKPDILITDDYFPRLRITAKFKGEFNIRTCVYVQILFGSHIFADVFNTTCLSVKEKIELGILKYAFYNLFKSWYKKLVLMHDVIITNSKIGSTFLTIIYGIESRTIVYPPIDKSIFKPENRQKNNQVLLYVGSSTGDTDEAFLRKLCKFLQNKKFRVLVLGDRTVQQKLIREFPLCQILEVTDEKLAQIYSESKLTICPQKWELFGYVVAESILCGTPVLAFNCMGPAEIITQTNGGHLANNKEDFLKKLEVLNFDSIEKVPNVSLYDVIYSSEKLMNAIEML